MKELTKAEEQVMQILWQINKGFVNDVLDRLPEPKPAYNTVSTIIRILEKKGFVAHKAFGKTHQYYPVVTKEKYTSGFFKRLVKTYFGNSYSSMASFLASDSNVSMQDLEQMKQMIEEEINKQKSKDHE